MAAADGACSSLFVAGQQLLRDRVSGCLGAWGEWRVPVVWSSWSWASSSSSNVSRKSVSFAASVCCTFRSSCCANTASSALFCASYAAFTAFVSGVGSVSHVEGGGQKGSFVPPEPTLRFSLATCFSARFALAVSAVAKRYMSFALVGSFLALASDDWIGLRSRLFWNCDAVGMSRRTEDGRAVGGPPRREALREVVDADAC